MKIFYVLLLVTLIVTLWYYYDRMYTLINFLYGIILLGLVYNFRRIELQKFLPTFFVILIPFFIVNGTLTGSFIHEEVVWYNNAENLGLRIGTVPIEDSIYALTMLLTIYILMVYFEERWPAKTKN